MRGLAPLITPGKTKRQKKESKYNPEKRPSCPSFLNVSIIPLPVIPECIYQESKL